MNYLFDTNAVIIAVQGARTRDTHQEQAAEDVQARRAQAFLAKRKKAELAISAITFTEYVSGYPPGQHEQHAARLNELFQVYPLDAVVAEVAATIRNAAWDDKMIAAAYEGRRKCFAADCCIVATALVRNVKTIVAYDKGVAKVLERATTLKNQHLVKRIPTLMNQFDHGDQMDAFGPN